MWKKFLEGFDTPLEIAGWLVCGAGLVMLTVPRFEGYEAGAMVLLGVLTGGGVRHFRGLTIGPGGIVVKGEDKND